MNKISVLCIMFFCVNLNATTLYDLEKFRSENTAKQLDLMTEIQLIQKKMSETQSAIKERKSDLIKFIKADQRLSKFQFGGLMAIENLPRFNRSLEIFQKIKLKNINSLREHKFASAELQQQQQILLSAKENLITLNQQLFEQEQQILSAEKETVNRLKNEKKDSLLIYKGTLSAPIQNANLKSSFGPYNDPKNQYSIFHKGLTFNSKIHQNIQAVSPGKIIFRDHIRYWGESVIIQHAGDYYSVYTNLTNCAVENNQNVSQGEKICETNGAEFYFELRNQNIAINPKNWIRN